MHLSVMVLPAPDGPKSAVTDPPSCAVNFASSVKSSSLFLMSTPSIIASASPRGRGPRAS